MQSTQWKNVEVPEPFQELLKQREQLRQQRKELIAQLYETIAELEGRPVRRPSIGFPFNLVVRFVQRTLNCLEALVQHGLEALSNK